MAQPEWQPVTGELPATPPGRLLPFERSALLHPRAADALVLAASPYPGRSPRPRRGVPESRRAGRLWRWFARPAT